MEGCSFDRCNWHLDCVLPWGSPETLNAVQVVMNLVRQGQENLPAAEAEGQQQQQGGEGQGGQGGGGDWCIGTSPSLTGSCLLSSRTP